MDTTMKLKIIQWKSTGDVSRNLEFILDRIGKTGKDSFVIFPEYSMIYPDYKDTQSFIEKSQGIGDFFIHSIQDSARKNSVEVMINFAEKSYGKPFNTSLHINSSGMISARYSKTHLFDSYGFQESSLYRRGMNIPDPFQVSGRFLAGVEICYDIRFPEITRMYSLKGASILLVQAGFYRGEMKYDTWMTMLRARAMENGMFVLAANQCGPDFLGHSTVIDPYGRILAEAGEEPMDLEASVDLSIVEKYREDVPVLNHRRKDLYEVGGL